MARDVAFDYTRGIAVFSMVTGHLAAGSLIAKPTHAVPYFDGASAFVLVSGLILGIVYSRWASEVSRVRLIRRIVVIYCAQALICLVAVLVSLWRGAPPGLRPLAGWSDGLAKAFSLQYMPAGGDILTLYFVLMLGSMVVIEFLRRGQWRTILLGSLVLYGLSQVTSWNWLYIPNFSDVGVIANWAAWQVLFVPAIVVGWHWNSWNLPIWLDRRLPIFVALSVVVALLSHLGARLVPAADIHSFAGAKIDMGPGRACAAWILTLTLYAVLRRFGRRRVLRPLELTGARSLDSYVIQAVLILLIPIVVAKPWNELEATLVALAVFFVAYGWAEIRRHYEIDKLHYAPQILVRHLTQSSSRG